jgi:hypothetical protein
MSIDGFWSVFGVGCLGGFLIELARWWKLRESDGLPAYARRPFYWLISVAMCVAGGTVAAMYGITERSAILVLNIGAAAPAMIAALGRPPQLDPAPTHTPDEGDAGGTVAGPMSSSARATVKKFIFMRG